MTLRAKDIDTLILFGIAASGVVLSTLLRAAGADYRLVVIKDCSADLDLVESLCVSLPLAISRRMVWLYSHRVS